MFGKSYIKKLCRKEYESQKFYWVNERPVEYRFVLEALSKTSSRTVLDVGAGDTAFPHTLRHCGYLVTAIDNIKDYWNESMVNRHYHVIDDDITQTRLTQKFDFIACVSVLEHIKNHEAAVRNMLTLLNAGGHLALTVPFNEHRYVDNVYKLPGAGYGQNAPYICQVYSRAEVDRWLSGTAAKITAQEYWQIFSGELWTFGERIYPPRQVKQDERYQLTCLLIRKEGV